MRRRVTMTNSVIKKIVYKLDIKFVSPINLSSGKEGMTDNDLLVDFDGVPFIPGTSIAGAFRNYFDDNSLFGFSDDDDNGKMSSLFISDLTFNKTNKDIRDGVALDDNKITKKGAKFDFEIIGSDASGYFYIELTVRENDDEDSLRGVLCDVVSGIKKHEIRLGSNKTRGYGIIDLAKVSCKEFNKHNYLEYAKAFEVESYEGLSDIKDSFDSEYSNMVKISVPLKLDGGISIRKYSVKKNEPDFEQLTDNGYPVIPGTSMAGALRHRVKDILRSLKNNELDLDENRLIDEMFGFVNEKSKKAHSSNVVIDEVAIHNSRPLVITRTGVSRFESSAKDGALYKEKTYVEGDFNLNIYIKDQKDWIMGILLLAIKDLQNGYLAVGGQTSIGRGIFKANGPILIDGKENKEDEYIACSIKNYKESHVTR